MPVPSPRLDPAVEADFIGQGGDLRTTPPTPPQQLRDRMTKCCRQDEADEAKVEGGGKRATLFSPLPLPSHPLAP